jgi:hypothetical protein
MSSSLQDLAIIYEIFPKLVLCHSPVALTLDLIAESPTQTPDDMRFEADEVKHKQGFLQLLLLPPDC